MELPVEEHADEQENNNKLPPGVCNGPFGSPLCNSDGEGEDPPSPAATLISKEVQDRPMIETVNSAEGNALEVT